MGGTFSRVRTSESLVEEISAVTRLRDSDKAHETQKMDALCRQKEESIGLARQALFLSQLQINANIARNFGSIESGKLRALRR